MRSATLSETPALESVQRVISRKLFPIRVGGAVTLSTEAPEPRRRVFRPLRAARSLALAHRMQATMDGDGLSTHDEVAERFGLTQARISQLFRLLVLAPDLQEELLFWEVEEGLDPITEGDLRRVVREPIWSKQREVWRTLRQRHTVRRPCR